MGKANLYIRLFNKIDEHGEFGSYIQMVYACIIAKPQCMDVTCFNEKILMEKQKLNAF